MGSRGRKSPAALTVVPIGFDTRRPDPPEGLSKAGAAIWRAVIGDLPGGWVTPANEAMLTAYCWHIDTGRRLSSMIDALDFAVTDIRQLGRLLEMRARETAASASMATKLRLTPQSRIGPRTAARRADGPTGSRPWEPDGAA
jgi:phage terminase small subunit